MHFFQKKNQKSLCQRSKFPKKFQKCPPKKNVNVKKGFWHSIQKTYPSKKRNKIHTSSPKEIVTMTKNEHIETKKQ